MTNNKTVQVVTAITSTFTLIPTDLNRYDSEARSQRISEIICRDLADQRRHMLQGVDSPGSLSSDLVVRKSMGAGDQNSNNPITAINPELQAMAGAVNLSVNAESSNLGQASRSP
jgi:hypothetical protein